VRGLLVLLIVVIIGILAYSTGLFGLASGKITLGVSMYLGGVPR